MQRRWTLFDSKAQSIWIGIVTLRCDCVDKIHCYLCECVDLYEENWIGCGREQVCDTTATRTGNAEGTVKGKKSEKGW